MTKENLKIVFLGTPEFAAYSLEKFIEKGFNVAAVVTMPDKQAGRGHHLLQSAVKQTALAHGLPVLQPVSLKDEAFVSQLRAIGANLFVVIAFRMLPEVVWSMPELGTFNLHASLLPAYRGAAPINRAVMNGDTRTGVTTFFLKHEIDTGDIIAQEAIDIAPDENVGSVHDRLMELGAELTIRTLEDIVAGTLRTTPQESLLAKGELPTQAPKIFKETCMIDWNQPAAKVYNHIRGLSPYPAAWTTLADQSLPEGGLQLKIFQTEKTDRTAEAPGSVHLTAKGEMLIDCADTALKITELQLQGRKRMKTDDFLRGAKLLNPKVS
ncbi:MAG: methionyl-tRNA formyltransferase [Muribaculaceae bacterium]|nr:methionyl-tRNA formyltransferase [Muribaculaceae bacterium]